MRLQRNAGRLLAVAQRRIEYLDPAGHEHVLSELESHLWCDEVGVCVSKDACSCISPLGENEDDDDKNEPGKGRYACPGGRHRLPRVHAAAALVKSLRLVKPENADGAQPDASLGSVA
jgi:hypothetical protein